MKRFMLGWLNWLLMKEFVSWCEREAQFHEANAEAAHAEASRWLDRRAMFLRIQEGTRDLVTKSDPEIAAAIFEKAKR